MRLRDDIDPVNTWVTSDQHFGHENIVGFCHRPLDHEQVMIAEWRKEVPDDATVVHLGDLCYRGNAFFKHITAKELTGSRKLLIEGNHDRQRGSFYRTAGFQLVKPFEIQWKWWRVSFSHYPMNAEERSWQQRNYAEPGGRKHVLRLHGHIHNNGYSRDAFVPFLRDHVNLSVEQTKYRPVNLEALLRGVLLGDYPETTEEQHAEAAARKKEAMS